jgi:hypothetical protein
MTTRAALPSYVQVGSKKTFAAPYQASGIRFYGFVLEGDADAMKASVAASLNAPSGGATNYQPVLPFALLSFVNIASIASTTAPDASVGFVPEREATFWVLTMSEKKEMGFDVIQSIQFWVPYIFVDSPNALLTGREVEGFPNEWAEVDVGRDAPGDMAARAWVFPEYAPQTEVSKQTVLTCVPWSTSRGTAGAVVRGPDWTTLEDAMRGIWRAVFPHGDPPVIPGVSLFVQLIEMLVEKEVSLVFLKQMRDLSDSTKACYQAIVEAPIKVTGFRGANLLPDLYDLTIADYESHPILKDLGISPESTKGLIGFWIDFDFLLENGTTVWQAGTQTGAQASAR